MTTLYKEVDDPCTHFYTRPVRPPARSGVYLQVIVSEEIIKSAHSRSPTWFLIVGHTFSLCEGLVHEEQIRLQGLQQTGLIHV